MRFLKDRRTRRQRNVSHSSPKWLRKTRLITSNTGSVAICSTRFSRSPPCESPYSGGPKRQNVLGTATGTTSPSWGTRRSLVVVSIRASSVQKNCANSPSTLSGPSTQAAPVLRSGLSGDQSSQLLCVISVIAGESSLIRKRPFARRASGKLPYSAFAICEFRISIGARSSRSSRYGMAAELLRSGQRREVIVDTVLGQDDGPNWAAKVKCR